MGDEAPFLMTASLPKLSAKSASKIWVLQTRLKFNRVERNTTRQIMNAEAQCLDGNQGVVAVLRHLGKNERTLITLWDTARVGPFHEFTSRGLTNGSVYWRCGCDRCDST